VAGHLSVAAVSTWRDVAPRIGCMTPQTATSVSVGVRMLRDHLSRYLELVSAGSEVVVTDRGRPIARLVAHDGDTALDRLAAAGLVRPPLRPKMPASDIRRVKPTGEVASLVSEQRS
jgi:prevent-host-death family protein